MSLTLHYSRSRLQSWPAPHGFGVIGVLLLGLLAAAALGFYGYELYRLNGALSRYQQAMLQHQAEYGRRRRY